MNQSQATIKKASIEDAEEILKIQKDAFLDQAKIYNNCTLPPLRQSIESIREEFNIKIFLKALFNGEIVGSVRFTERNHSIEIERLTVVPKFQNQGIGSKLLSEIEIMEPNAPRFLLFTGNKSERNIHLYQKMGFQIAGRETTNQGIELLHMVKKP
jgi:ribosomal protein S18 acetylase RimI-like enzyme